MKHSALFLNGIILASQLFISLSIASAGGGDEKKPEDHSQCAPSGQLEKGWYRGWVPDKNGNAVERLYEMKNGRMMNQGDMVLSSELVSKSKFVKSNPMGGISRWPGGRVPYVISDIFTFVEKQNIRHGIDIWNEAAGGLISLVPRSDEKRYLLIDGSERGCWGEMPTVTSRKFVVSLDKSQLCAFHFPTIVHEIGHALGLEHEHNRLDRDQHVEVLWCNLSDGHKHNFEKIGEGHKFKAYDFNSIMHYSFLVAPGGKPQLRAKGTAPSWFRQLLDPNPSAGDVEGIQNYYDKNNATKTARHSYKRVDYMDHKYVECKPLTDSASDGWSVDKAQRLTSKKNPNRIVFQPIDYCVSNSTVVEYDCDEWGYLRKREVTCAANTHSCVSGKCQAKVR